MRIDRNHAKSAFEEYTRHYDTGDDKARLKIEHTYRVAGLCETIAGTVMKDPEEIDLAWLSGLLHDVGRFEQVRIYGTFQDSVSVDHAAFGADILFQEGRIRDYVEEDTENALLERAIRLHNVYRMPEGLTERERTFADILRDADKIDIMRVNVEFPLEKIYNVSTKELKEAELSDEVFLNFCERRTSLRKPGQTVADSIVNQLSFAFELVYPISLKIMAGQGYLDRFLSFESENPVTGERMRRVREEMKRFLNEKGIAVCK